MQRFIDISKLSLLAVICYILLVPTGSITSEDIGNADLEDMQVAIAVFGIRFITHISHS